MVSRTLIRDLPDRSRVVVHLLLRERGDPGELSPVFSVTTDRYEPHGTRRATPAVLVRLPRVLDPCLPELRLHARGLTPTGEYE
jgi:hypothetical protein